VPNPAVITAGGTSTLTAVFVNGTGVITPGNLPANSGTSVAVTPVTTTTYTLTVTGASGATVTQAATITVYHAPTITSFGANSAAITSGGTSALTAVFANGTGVITPGNLPATSGTSVAITPVTTTTYTLTVTGGSGAVLTAQFLVTVVPAPAITSFLAGPSTITAGHGSILSYSFSGGTGAINQGLGLVTSPGNSNVGPSTTTIYTLTATNAAGDATSATATVTVVPAPAITAFTAVPSTLTAGQSAVLMAAFTNGAGVVDAGVGQVSTRVGVTVSPVATTTYTLTVTNANGDLITANVLVTVNPIPTLAVEITGLGALPADVTVTGPDAYVQHLTATQTLQNLAPGTYTLKAATVMDPSQPSLGLDLAPGAPALARYPYQFVQTVEVASGPAAATVDYPSAMLTMQIPTKENPVTKVPMDFVLVPAGQFTMGSGDPADQVPSLAATPAHAVAFSRALYVGRALVTQAQWMAVMGATNNPSHFDGSACGYALPVDTVCYYDAWSDFLPSLERALPSNGFRLPTEAEWEYVCRAGTTTAFFFGTDMTNISKYAWCYLNAGGATHPVATLAPNPWGLYDMVGNVWQWCGDDAHPDYAGAPVDGSAWVDSPRGNDRILRGGSYYYIGSDQAPLLYRSAYRSSMYPLAYNRPVGFRVVMSAMNAGPTPTISSFQATPASLTVGDKATLTFAFDGGTGVITPGSLEATSGTALTMAPTVTTTYKLSVTNGAGRTVSRTATVTVMPLAPAITSFLAIPASIPAGGTAALTGLFDSGTGVITPGNLNAVSGTPVIVKPAATTTYTLTVTNSAGVSVTQTALVTVTPPSIGSFAASPPTIITGNSTTLTGVFSNGTGLITPGNLTVTTGTGVAVAPTSSTTYTLTVTNSAGVSATKTAVVTVTPPPAPYISSFSGNPLSVPWGGGTTVQLTGLFGNGKGVITPGNISVDGLFNLNVSPTASTTYQLTVTNSVGNYMTSTLAVTAYLVGTYNYSNPYPYPTTAHFIFYSTGIGNFYWTRTFPGSVDGWGGTFNYKIIGSTVDLYWTNGSRSGSHSTISSFDNSSLYFESTNYHK
jgi:formylglycine-generating enzyme required for sulfatase activity